LIKLNDSIVQPKDDNAPTIATNIVKIEPGYRKCWLA